MKNKIITTLNKRWLINTFIVLSLLVIIITSTGIRLQNLPLLVDQTSGEYIPLALDPFYFLRTAQIIIDQGGLPAVDNMRYPSLNLPYINEILPQTIVFLYKTLKIFNNDITLQLVDVLYPVIFFVIGLIIFFFLVYVLTKSKGTALLSCTLLAFIQPYLYRTMAGFSDHESLGMAVFFLTLLIYALSLKYLEKKDNNYLKIILYSILTAFLTVFMMVSWGGGSSFLLIIIPLSFLIIWLIKFKIVEHSSLDSIKKYLTFYLTWFISTILFGILFNYSFFIMIRKFTSSTGLISSFTFGFIICELIVYKLISKGYFSKLKNYKVIISIFGAILMGIMLFILADRNILQIITSILGIFLQPFGTSRVTLTVAENAQPFLMDWMSQIGKILFWISLSGIILIGIELGNRIKHNKKKTYFIIAWIIFTVGILFSRIDPTSVLNGISFVSIALYFIGLLSLLITGILIYFKNNNPPTIIKLDSQLILLAVLMLLMVVSIRSATRVFFLIVPFACLSASFFVFKTIDIYKGHKDEVVRFFLILIIIFSLIGLAYVIGTSFNIINYQAKYTSPSAHLQWQQAMSWIRQNTIPGSIFVHWWDYGYWVQYLGERPTITDGGHGNDYWDHLIGRYVLTTPNPNTALAFMKAQDVSYLLIDQTDLGKYPAYSKIGGDENYDRFSIISTGIVDDKQTIETNDKITRIYNIGGIVDEDIEYGEGNNKILLPGPNYDKIGNPSFNSYIGNVIIEIANNSINQPQGIFVYNNQQVRIPIRYLYFNEHIIDFGTGINSTIYLFPKASQNTNGNLNIDQLGAIIYLSPKVSKSLFAQLYLMNDPFNNYSTIKLVHSELDLIAKNLKEQGVNINENIYYQGFRGPIKIFEVDYPEGFPLINDLTKTSGGYAELDYLFE